MDFASASPADDVLLVIGPRPPEPAARPIVLDSPHSGRRMPPDFGCIATERDLRQFEDCFIDALWAPAAERGIPLLAAQFPRTYLDVNRHADDVDLELLAEPWPRPLAPSGKGSIGKSLVWRTLDNDQPIYDRRLSVAEVQSRIDRCLKPYRQTLAELIEAAQARHGAVIHLNCHSMGAETTVQIEGVAGRPRADIVLGDRDGSTCDPALTAEAAAFLAGRGYSVKVNDPFKGVELVRAHGQPAAGRHSLQIELNKRLYMDSAALARSAGFDRVQADLMALLDRLSDWAAARVAGRAA